MIASIVLELDGNPEAHFDAHQARAALLRLMNPELGAVLHDMPSPKAYTTSAGTYRQQPFLRFSIFKPELYDACCSSLYSAAGNSIRLGEEVFQIAQVLDRDHPAAGITSPSLLLRQDVILEKRIGFEFLTPTAFKRSPRVVPLPEPKLVFQGLLEKWNAHCGGTIPREFIDWVEQTVVIADFRLRSRTAKAHHAVLVGCVGQVWYKALDTKHPWHVFVGQLAGFAPFASVGYQTTLGFGRVKLLKNQSKSDLQDQ
jgi:CRISPR-associated endoribonuclease Cas6